MLEATPIVFVVDDDVSARESVKRLLRSAGLRAEVFGTALEFLARGRARAPCCLVLDVTLPDLNGLELQKRVAVERSEMPIIFITGCRDVATGVRAMKAGALEFLTKPVEADELLGAVRNAIECSRMMLAREAELRALRERHGSLTRREREVMILVAAGQLNKQAGGELGISEVTVKAHRGSVMRKMQAESFAHLIAMVAKLELTVAPRHDTAIDTGRTSFSHSLAHA
jgi:FixJ family two-component response regulator